MSGAKILGLCSLQFDDFGLEDKDTLKVKEIVMLVIMMMIITLFPSKKLLNTILFITVSPPLLLLRHSHYGQTTTTRNIAEPTINQTQTHTNWGKWDDRCCDF